MLQIIMTLLYYQRSYHFTHNDLHTNNIMYNTTTIKFLYYKYNNKIYKVPTYGKIYKLIDFGRSIYKFNGKQFCSDSFARKGDAYTQYNCEPFINKNKPTIEPNYSFDLCRLGCSMYDFIMDSDNVDMLVQTQTLITQWCLDDNGRSVLYKKNGDERYHNFTLYKMIARRVHNHTPELQLELPIFKSFISSDKIEIEQSIMDIDSIICYA